MFVRLVWFGCLVSIALAVAGWLLFRFELASFRFAFLAFVAGLGSSSLAWLLSLVAMMVGRIRRRPVESRLTRASIIGVLPILTVFSLIGIEGFSAPMMHDISTDTENPPALILAAQQREEEENSTDYAGASLAKMQSEYYPDIQPLELSVSAEQLASAIRQYIGSRGWQELGAGNDPFQIEAVARSRLMGFEDDVVFRITQKSDRTILDIRSASRLGVGDLGANAKRVRHALKNIQSQLQKASNKL